MDIKHFDSRFQMMPIKRIIEENPTTKTFVFEYELGSKPGQFLMLWIPGVDEKPMSVAYDDGKEFWVTTCKVGPFSEHLHTLKEGDLLGIRGPLGTHYNFKKGEHLALVSGGYGAAPMYYVANEAVKLGCKVDFLIGARTKDLLLYIQKVLGLGGVDLHISTNDGSEGFEGFVTVLLDRLLEKGGVDKVFTCGPEVMMNAVGAVVDKHGTETWMSMEKYMKCGVGVCGQCAVDDSGELVCKKGPVMPWKSLKNLPEMGKYHRDAQGKKHYF
ncbi:dihydroorotate dehydrogenase electron transfer subunit [Candidatus Peregrinibacteria bacterium]|nr:dihydroorotate dehydrogenase electron transfer subunit [Candidatus Peregrinibacteria bacterium]